MNKKVLIMILILIVLTTHGCSNTEETSVANTIGQEETNDGTNNTVNEQSEILNKQFEDIKDEHNPILNYKDVKNLKTIYIDDINDEFTLIAKRWSEEIHKSEERISIDLKDVSKLYIYLIDGANEENINLSQRVEYSNLTDYNSNSESIKGEHITESYYLLITREYSLDETTRWETSYIDIPRSDKNYMYEAFNNPSTVSTEDPKANIVWNYFMSSNEIIFTDNIFDTVLASDFSILVEVD